VETKYPESKFPDAKTHRHAILSTLASFFTIQGSKQREKSKKVRNSEFSNNLKREQEEAFATATQYLNSAEQLDFNNARSIVAKGYL
jgi:hypothetical protein